MAGRNAIPSFAQKIEQYAQALTPKHTAIAFVLIGMYFAVFSSVPVIHRWRCDNQPTDAMFTLGVIADQVHQRLHIPVRSFYNDTFGPLEWPQDRDLVEVARPRLVMASDSLARPVITQSTPRLDITWYRRGWQVLAAVPYHYRAGAPIDTSTLSSREFRQLVASAQLMSAGSLQRLLPDSAVYAGASLEGRLALEMGNACSGYFSHSTENQRQEEIKGFCWRLRQATDSTLVFSAGSLADQIWQAASYHSLHPLSEKRMVQLLWIAIGMIAVGLLMFVLEVITLVRMSAGLEQQFAERGCVFKRRHWLQCCTLVENDVWLERREKFLMRLASDQGREIAWALRYDRQDRKRRQAAERQNQQRRRNMEERLAKLMAKYPNGSMPASVQSFIDQAVDESLPMTARLTAMWSAENQYQRLQQTPVSRPTRVTTPVVAASVETQPERLERLWERIKPIGNADIAPAGRMKYVTLRRRYDGLPTSAPLTYRLQLLEQLDDIVAQYHVGSNGDQATSRVDSLDQLWDRLFVDVSPHVVDGTCVRHVTAILLFGLMQPGRRGGIRSTNVYIKFESMVDNVRRKLKNEFDSVLFQRALAWLEQNKLLIYHKQGQTVALNLHLRGRRGTLTIPEPTDVGREVILTLKRLNMELIRATT